MRADDRDHLFEVAADRSLNRLDKARPVAGTVVVGIAEIRTTSETRDVLLAVKLRKFVCHQSIFLHHIRHIINNIGIRTVLITSVFVRHDAHGCKCVPGWCIGFGMAKRQTKSPPKRQTKAAKKKGRPSRSRGAAKSSDAASARWTVRGITTNVRVIVAKAAKKRGMTAGDWLAEAIVKYAKSDAAALPAKPATDIMSTVAEMNERLGSLETRQKAGVLDWPIRNERENRLTPKGKQIAAGMGSRLRALRLAMGYESAAAFARYLDVPASTVQRCERGQRISDHSVLPLGTALYDKAGFTYNWFIMGIPQGKTRVKRPKTH